MRQDRAKEFISRLEEMRDDLPVSPALLDALFRKTGDNSFAPLAEIADTLSEDQGLATKALSVANSAFYGLQSEVTSIQRAASILGLTEIRSMVISACVSDISNRQPLPDDFRLDIYWKHQFLTALIVKELAIAAEYAEPDTLFACGLLHDLGILAMAMLAPEDWREVNMIEADKALPRNLAEDEYWGLDHGVAGALLLRSWDFPEAMVEPVNWHHAPMVAPAFRTEAQLLALADNAAHAVLEEEPELNNDGRTLCKALSLDETTVLAIATAQRDSETLSHCDQLLAA